MRGHVAYGTRKRTVRASARAMLAASISAGVRFSYASLSAAYSTFWSRICWLYTCKRDLVSTCRRGRDETTCLLLQGGEVLPEVGDLAEELRVGELRVDLLELATDRVLEVDVGRRGALGGVGVLGLGVALALLGAVVVGRVGLALACARSVSGGDATRGAGGTYR